MLEWLSQLFRRSKPHFDADLSGSLRRAVKSRYEQSLGQGTESAEPAEDDSELGFVKAARRFSEWTDLSEDEILQRDINWVMHPAYPTPDCLDVSDIELLIEGDLPTNREAHARDCFHCRALLEAINTEAVLPPRLKDEIRGQVTPFDNPPQHPAALLEILENQGVGNWTTLDAAVTHHEVASLANPHPNQPD